MENKAKIKVIQQDDIPKIIEIMKEPYMLGRESKYQAYFTRCCEENKYGKRVTFIAYCGDSVAGYVNIIFESDYPHFKTKNIPEINDLYVVPAYRNIGIGKLLLSSCEDNASKAGYEQIGLGVGLYKDYGSAQRLYTENGYKLDGNGLMFNNIQVKPGSTVIVDDDLLLYLYKDL